MEGTTPRLSWSERKSLVPPAGPTAGVEGNANPYIMRPEAKANPYAMGRQTSEYGVSMDNPVKQETTEEKLRMTEVETAALRAREEAARVMAELPVVKVSHGGAAWEVEVCCSRVDAYGSEADTIQLAHHYKAMQALQQNTFRAQSAARHAAAVLADAEGERIAAGERRKVVEAQLMAGSLGVGVGVGIMGA